MGPASHPFSLCRFLLPSLTYSVACIMLNMVVFLEESGISWSAPVTLKFSQTYLIGSKGIASHILTQAESLWCSTGTQNMVVFVEFKPTRYP